MNLQEFLINLPEPNGKPVVSILSGGLDSTILTHILAHIYGRENVYALTFDYGQRHRIELDKAQITCNKLGIKQKVLDINFLGDINKDFSSLSANSSKEVQNIEEVLGLPQPVQYVANRNSILTNIAVSFAETVGADKVALGIQSHDTLGYWDTTRDFVNSLNKTFQLNREHSIQVIAPFLGIWKNDEISIGKELGVDFSDTWTCYKGPDEEGLACGECPACVERRTAFRKLGLVDSIRYATKLK